MESLNKEPTPGSNLTRSYYARPAAAFILGNLQPRANDSPDHTEILSSPRGRSLADLPEEELATIIALGLRSGLELFPFKRSRIMPRVRWALGILRGLSPNALLDIGPGRGPTLWPVLDAVPNVGVTFLERSDSSIQRLGSVRAGGLSKLRIVQGDAVQMPFRNAAFDGVSLLEVLEHVGDPGAAIGEAVRIARRFVIVTVPSVPDDNPEHLHLFRQESLTTLFRRVGVSRVKIGTVPGHWTILALVNP